MPIYTFKCNACDKLYEEIVPMGTESFKCSCGKNAVKVPSLSNFQLKGSNWARDNYGLSKKDK